MRTCLVRCVQNMVDDASLWLLSAHKCVQAVDDARTPRQTGDTEVCILFMILIGHVRCLKTVVCTVQMVLESHILRWLTNVC